MRRDRADVADAIPPFRVTDVKRIDGGSLCASFDLRILDGTVYLKGVKYYCKDARTWVRASHKDDRSGAWVVDVLFSEQFSDAIAAVVEQALYSIPPVQARESSRPSGQRNAEPHRASTVAGDTIAQRRRDALFDAGESALADAMRDLE
jgi:hypothetical protein